MWFTVDLRKSMKLLHCSSVASVEEDSCGFRRWFMVGKRQFRVARVFINEAMEQEAVFIVCSSCVNQGAEREKLTSCDMTGAWRSKTLLRDVLVLLIHPLMQRLGR